MCQKNQQNNLIEYNLCQCCKSVEGEILHTCPFDEEINHDFETLCNCCVDCTNKCNENI